MEEGVTGVAGVQELQNGRRGPVCAHGFLAREISRIRNLPPEALRLQLLAPSFCNYWTPVTPATPSSIAFAMAEEEA